MENASKALIIAGAILLAILLISLGIMIFGQAQDTVNNGGMSDAEMQAFNSKFLKYEGKNKTGSEVKALLNEINVNNSTQDSSRHIGFASGNTVTATVNVDSHAKYDIEFTLQNGIIHEVKITSSGSTTTTTP